MLKRNPFVFTSVEELQNNYLKLFPKDEKGLPIIPKGFCKAIAGDNKPNWYYGFFCPKGFGDCDFDCLFPSNYDDFRNAWLCDANTVCYFTGRFDKNGTPIFENDLVKGGDLAEPKDFDENNPIDYDILILTEIQCTFFPDECEVIGNKFDYMISDELSYKKFLDTQD